MERKMKVYEIPVQWVGKIRIKAFNSFDADCCLEEMSSIDIAKEVSGDWEVIGESAESDNLFGAVNAYEWINDED